jgi:DNA-binding MarR family transcriptional regulator
MSTLPLQLEHGNFPPIQRAFARLREGIFRIHPLHDTHSGECSCGGKAVNPNCSPGKHPRRFGYKREATDDPLVIERMWARSPHANIGGIVSPGVAVLDVDLRHDGHTARAALEKKYAQLPTTITVETAGGGRHYYFHFPEGFSPSSQKMQVSGYGIELLFAGSNVLLVGSVVNGIEYRYAIGLSPHEIAIAELPMWLLEERSLPDSPTIRAQLPVKRMQRVIPTSIPTGTRNTTLVSLAGTLINAGVRDDALVAELIEIDGKHCHPSLGESEVRKLAQSMENTHDNKPQTDAWKIKNRERVLTVLDHALATTWTGKTGNSEFSILFALLAIAHESGNLRVEISYRQIAELGCLTIDTISRRIHGLIKKKWIRIHASYKERIAVLAANHAKNKDFANAKTVYDLIIPMPHKQNITPTPPLLFWLCGMDCFRVRALGMSAIKILTVLMKKSFPSVRQLALAAKMNPDTAERKIKKMVGLGWVKKTDEKIELVDMSEMDFVEAAKILGTFGKGEKQRKLHQHQQQKNVEYWKKKMGEAEEKQEVPQDEERTIYVLEPERVKVFVPDVFVNTVLNVFSGSQIVCGAFAYSPG